MIRTALKFIKKELEDYIVEREQDTANYNLDNVVDLRSIVSPNGTINLEEAMNITIMLVGIEEVRREGKRPFYIPAESKEFLKLNPPIELELLIVFAAHKEDYETALRDLSNIVSFFQANSVFDEQKYPSLNATATEPDRKPWRLIERLSFKICNLSFEQQNNLWAMLGCKYLPSVIYKMNLLTVFETKAKEKVPAIDELNLEEN